MIQLTIIIPLFVSGLVGAIWREHRNQINHKQPISLPVAANFGEPQALPELPEKVFDDMEEINHYRHVSWYAVAFSLSGSWFFAPATLASLPLLSYNGYNFVKTLRQTDATARNSPMAIFEVIGVAGTILTGRPLLASLMFLFSFASRNLQLHIKSLSQVDFSNVLNPNFKKVWVLHGDAEIETPINELEADDIVVIHSGEIVLIEGTVLDGQGLVRQYSLQKKMKSVPKQRGDKVFPYTQLESGYLHIQKHTLF